MGCVTKIGKLGGGPCRGGGVFETPRNKGAGGLRKEPRKSGPRLSKGICGCTNVPTAGGLGARGLLDCKRGALGRGKNKLGCGASGNFSTSLTLISIIGGSRNWLRINPLRAHKRAIACTRRKLACQRFERQCKRQRKRQRIRRTFSNLVGTKSFMTLHADRGVVNGGPPAPTDAPHEAAHSVAPAPKANAPTPVTSQAKGWAASRPPS